jgi:hypothetical protein
VSRPGRAVCFGGTTVASPNTAREGRDHRELSWRGDELAWRTSPLNNSMAPPDASGDAIEDVSLTR